MEIREASEIDIPNILSVLKSSLGEVSSKKTQEVWEYKHIENPFGKSLVLLAVIDDEVVGVRAFMKWKWQLGDKEFIACRAVDTATHPNHQGKGVFKKLTLKAIDIAKKNGWHFIFNTPNSQSKPGYLKMGWSEVDSVKVQITPVNYLLKVLLTNKSLDLEISNELTENSRRLIVNHNKRLKANGLFTPKDLKFLLWRYVNNPMQDYIIYSNENLFIAAYVKTRSKLKEFRVAELIYKDKKSLAQANSVIQILAIKSYAHFISCQPLTTSLTKININLKLGPTLTYKNLNLNISEQKILKSIDSWKYSIGDLELF
jgi:predicted N-acetyltransferase YhbS